MCLSGGNQVCVYVCMFICMYLYTCIHSVYVCILESFQNKLNRGSEKEEKKLFRGLTRGASLQNLESVL